MQLQAVHPAHPGLTRKEIAELFDCDDRTVRRDLHSLEATGIPLQRTGRGAECRFKIDESSLPATHVRFDVGDVVALYVAQGFLGSMKGLPLIEEITNALEKAYAALPAGSVRKELDAYVAALASNLQGFHAYAPHGTRFRDLINAVCDQQPVDIDYLARGRDGPASYLVHPYLVHCHAGTVYVVAWVPARRALRTFALDRIAAVRVKDEDSFDRRDDFDPERFVAEGFGGYHEGDIVEVAVRFDHEVAPVIRERTWHPSQVLTDRPDGGVEVRFKTAGPTGVLHWTRAFLPYARILAPAALAGRQREDAKAWGVLLDNDGRPE